MKAFLLWGFLFHLNLVLPSAGSSWYETEMAFRFMVELPVLACCLLYQTEFEFLSLIKFLTAGNCCARYIYNVYYMKMCSKYANFCLKNRPKVQVIIQGIVILSFKAIFTF